MKTKPQIVLILSKRRARMDLKGATWTDLAAGISLLSDAEKQSLVDMIIAGNHAVTGRYLSGLLINNIKSKAKASVETALTDNSLSLAELDALL